MIKLLDDVGKKLDAANADVSRAMASKWMDYMAILRRAENPSPGDVDRLTALMRDLGIEPETAKEHLALLGQLKSLKAEADEIPTLEAAIASKTREFDAARKVVADARERVDVIYKAREQLQGSLERAKGQSEHVRVILKKEPELFSTVIASPPVSSAATVAPKEE